MKRLLLWVLCSTCLGACHLSAQSCTPNVPSTLSGFQSQQYSISYSGLSATPYRVQYITDAYPNYNPGLGAGSERGISLGPAVGPAAFALPINSTWYANGSRLVTANVYDVLGNLLTTCSATATTANAWPVASTPTLSVAASPSITAPVSGTLTITPTVGSVGSDTILIYLYVDGLATTQENAFTNGGAIGASIFTANWSNGAHVVCLYVNDTTGGLTHTPGYEGEAGEWCRTVTFSNGTTAMSASINNDKIYLAPANTLPLAAQTLNTDGATTAGSPVSVPRFFSNNTAIATVNQTTGVVTAVANGATFVTSIVPFVSGTDLVTNPSGVATSAAHPFNLGEGALNGNSKWGCYISAGTGFTVGFYSISTIQYVGGASPRIYGAGMGLPGNLTGGTYQCGPIAPSWIFVWPGNTLPYIGSDGSINTSYNPANAAVMHDIFSGINLLAFDQPYNYQGHANGAAFEFNNIGNWWAFETGAGCLGSACTFSDTAPTSGTYASFQSSLASSISTSMGFLQSQPNLYLYLNWSNITGANVNTYGAALGPGASLSPPAFQYMVQQYSNTGRVLGGYWHDEIPIGCPTCGPIVYDPPGTGTGQSWLISITATGGGGAGETCTAAIGPNGYTIYGVFIVTGSSVSNMNSVYPATYTPVAGSGKFHFTCPNVPDGVYNSSNDPGFTLQSISNGWVNSSGAYVPYNAFARMRSQINAVTGHIGFAGAPAGDNIGAIYSNGVCNANSVSNTFRSYGGFSPYTIGGLQAGDYTDLYSQTGFSGYIVSRASLNVNVNDPSWLGQAIRQLYGCGYSPSLPLNGLTQGTINYYGTKGVPVSLTSCVGNLCTFSAPVNMIMPKIIPGITRMYVTGATDVSSPQDTTNNNFVVVDCLTATTCHVDLAATDQTQNAGFTSGNTANSGTITTQDATTVTMQGSSGQAGGMSATGTQNCFNICLVDEMRPLATTGAGSATTLLRKRGQTFTFNGTASGVGASYFNANTFRIAPDWLNIATAPNTNVFYRQLPILNSTGGTAFLIPDDGYVKGRNASTGPGGPSSGSGDTNPEWMFVNTMECMLLRCSGERLYQMSSYANGYSDQTGLTPPGAFQVQWGPKVFSDNHAYQITVSPHFENGPAVPGAKAHIFAAMYWNRNVKFWQQPRLNAPNIGKPGEIECGAAAGTYGNILACVNATDGPRTVTIPTTLYLQSGQNFYWQTVDAYGMGAINVVTAGTTSIGPITLDHGQAVSLTFPANFAVELQQPVIGALLADIANASQMVVRYSYDPYYLDASGNVYNCGAAAVCTPGWDRNLGVIYFRVIYLGSSSQVLATSAVLVL